MEARQTGSIALTKDIGAWKTQEKPVAKAKSRAWIKYIVSFGLMLLCSSATVTKGIQPFGTGMYVALIFSGCNVLILTPLYIAAGLIVSPSIDTVITTVTASIVLLIATLIHLKLKKPVRQWQLGLYALLGQAGWLYLCFATQNNVLGGLVSLVFGTMFVYVASVSLLTVSPARAVSKRSGGELAAIGLFTVVLSMGVYCLPLIGEILSRAVFACLLILILRGKGVTYGVGFGLMYGLGCAVACQNVAFVAAYATIAAAGGLFARTGKIFSGIAVMLGDVVFGLYFYAYGDYTLALLLPFALALILGTTLPKVCAEAVVRIAGGADGSRSARSLVARERAQLSKKLYNASVLCAEIDQKFARLNGSEYDADKTAHIMLTRLCEGLCGDCKNNTNCYNAYREETTEAMRAVVTSSLVKNKAAISSVPTSLTARCFRVDGLLAEVDRLLTDINAKKAAAAARETARGLVNAHMQGVSGLLQRMSNDVGTMTQSFESEENFLTEELLGAGIDAGELTCSKTAGGTALDLIVSEQADFAEVCSVAGRALGRRLVLRSAEPVKGGVQLALFDAPKYDAMLGNASVTKAGSLESGDTYSVVKIGADKLLVALCDGMGSGSSALRMSDTTIGLIESFYKAEFDSASIVRLVNQIVASSGEESFSAVDLCVLDLRGGFADFIKIGGGYSLHLSGDSVSVADGGALPMGILDTVKPVVTRHPIKNGDVLILSTDGITDVFGSSSRFIDFVTLNLSINPQAMARSIAEYCCDADERQPHDDMTALVVRVVETR